MVHSTYTAALQLSLRVAVAAGLARPVAAAPVSHICNDFRRGGYRFGPGRNEEVGPAPPGWNCPGGYIRRANLSFAKSKCVGSGVGRSIGDVPEPSAASARCRQGGWLCMRHRSLRLRRCSLLIRSASHHRENDRNRACHTDKYCAQTPARAIRDEIV